MMKWKVFLLTLLFIFSLSPLSPLAEGEKGEKHREHHYHPIIDQEKISDLKQQGFSKQEIFIGALLSKKSGKDIDEVFQLYKEESSWEKVAEKLNVDFDDLKKWEGKHQWEVILKNHEEEVLNELAKYNLKKKKDMEKLLDDEISPRFLIGASVMAKLANKDVEEIVQYKKEGKTFQELKKELNLNEEELHKELSQFKTNLKNQLKEQLEKETKKE